MCGESDEVVSASWVVLFCQLRVFSALHNWAGENSKIIGYYVWMLRASLFSNGVYFILACYGSIFPKFGKVAQMV